jgi:hypothetical protein
METLMSEKTIAFATVVAGLMTLSFTTGARASTGPDDALLRESRQFELSNGDAKNISHHGEMYEYRVCVSDVRDSVPVKVVHDSRSSLVYPGDCADFSARRIAVAAGAALPSDTVLMGHYKFLNS